LKISISILILFLVGCASQEEVTVTGERVSRDSLKGKIVKEVKIQKDESLFDALLRLNGDSNYPKNSEFKSCSDLLPLLEARNIEVLTIEPQKIVTKANSGNTMTHTFENSKCTDKTAI